MKRLISLFLSGLLLLGAPAAVTDVVQRQNWPWDDLVAVDFALTALDGPVDVSLRAWSGGEDLGDVPEAALSGSRYALAQERSYRLVVDPAKCPAFAGRARMASFRFEVKTRPSTRADVLYREVDLTRPGTWRDITRGDILNGAWGAYETDPDWIQAHVKQNIEAWSGVPNLFLTGVTNNALYATDRLLLRRVNAGSYIVGSSSGTATSKRRTVAFTQPYWIGVFELTQRQWERITGAAAPDKQGKGDRRPVSGVTFDAVRGCAADNSAYNWPTGREVDPASFIGKLRALTGLPFDLPTEAQWQAAAGAGAYDCGCYDGSTSTANGEADPGWRLARCATNAGTTGSPFGGSAYVGRYLPNALGLYDALGNVRELALDWCAATTLGAQLTDDEGPAPDAAIPNRCILGGAASQSLTGGSILSGNRGDAKITPSTAHNDVGFRVCLPAGEAAHD